MKQLFIKKTNSVKNGCSLSKEHFPVVPGDWKCHLNTIVFAKTHVQLFARKKEDEKFQQVVYVNYKLEEFIYLLDVMNSVYEKVVTNQPICNVF